MYQKIIMNEGDRPLHLENVKRPYSWTGDLDASLPSDEAHPKSWNLSKTNSFKSPRDRVEGLNNMKGQEEWPLKPAIKSQVIRKHKGGSSPILLMDKLPHYLRNESNGALNDNEAEVTAALAASSRTTRVTTEGGEGGSAADKKRSKFPKLQRRGSPPLMTSQDDFEYFSLSTPPPGLARPVQIFPTKEKKEKIVKKSEKSQLGKPKLKPPVIIVDDYDDKGEKCRDCMTRIPYATLIATVMCCVGVGVFCGTMYRGTTLTLLMFDEVFRIQIQWDREFRVEPVQLTFMIIGAAMGALGLMILFLGCLSTGSTRSKVYKTWRGRVGGRVSCAIFMGITYILSVIWLLIFCALTIATIFYSLAWLQCKYIPENQCIDYNQFEFLFPSSTNEEDRRVCVEERKMFCKDCVNNAEVMFILATVAAFIVILSLIHYLMCLSANYAHIKDQEKFIDLQEIQYLQESEMSTLPKDRF